MFSRPVCLRSRPAVSNARAPRRCTTGTLAVASVVAALATAGTPAHAADVELVVNASDGGSLSLRSDTGNPFDIFSYSIFSAGGFLADLGDETLGGQLSPLLFDVDNAGSDEVAMWTLVGGSFGPDVTLPTSTPLGLELNLAWTGTGDPAADLTVEYGVSVGDPPVGTADVIEVTVSALTGDYDTSGQVEQGDLDIVLQNWGTGTFPGDEAALVGGGPFDGTVDQNELDGVLQNWGNTSSPDFSGSVVPEPVGVGIAVFGAVALRRRPVKSS